MLTSLAKHYKFDIETPYEDLPQKIKDIVMHGSGKEEIEFQYMNDRGDVVIRKHPFEGILNNMARRYKETESMSVREELAKNISNRPCADCGGSRLRPEARNVYIGSINLPQISEKSIGESLEFFPRAYLNRSKSTNCGKNPERDQRAVRILSECGVELSFPLSLS